MKKERTYSKRDKFLIARLITYAAIIAAFAILPPRTFEGYSLCVYTNLFGVKCIGCGMTRAFSHTMHGNFTRAVEYNPLVFVFLSIIAIIILWDLASFIAKTRGNSLRTPFDLFFNIR